MKKQRLLNSKYIDFIRSQPCLIVGSVPSIAHHVRMGGHGGMGLKPDDYKAVPLHPKMHSAFKGSLHIVGEKKFWLKSNINPEMKIIELMIEYCRINGITLPKFWHYEDLTQVIEAAR